MLWAFWAVLDNSDDTSKKDNDLTLPRRDGVARRAVSSLSRGVRSKIPKKKKKARAKVDPGPAWEDLLDDQQLDLLVPFNRGDILDLASDQATAVQKGRSTNSVCSSIVSVPSSSSQGFISTQVMATDSDNAQQVDIFRIDAQSIPVKEAISEPPHIAPSQLPFLTSPPSIGPRDFEVELAPQQPAATSTKAPQGTSSIELAAKKPSPAMTYRSCSPESANRVLSAVELDYMLRTVIDLDEPPRALQTAYLNAHEPEDGQGTSSASMHSSGNSVSTELVSPTSIYRPKRTTPVVCRITVGSGIDNHGRFPLEIYLNIFEHFDLAQLVRMTSMGSRYIHHVVKFYLRTRYRNLLAHFFGLHAYDIAAIITTYHGGVTGESARWLTISRFDPVRFFYLQALTIGVGAGAMADLEPKLNAAGLVRYREFKPITPSVYSVQACVMVSAYPEGSYWDSRIIEFSNKPPVQNNKNRQMTDPKHVWRAEDIFGHIDYDNAPDRRVVFVHQGSGVLYIQDLCVHANDTYHSGIWTESTYIDNNARDVLNNEVHMREGSMGTSPSLDMHRYSANLKRRGIKVIRPGHTKRVELCSGKDCPMRIRPFQGHDAGRIVVIFDEAVLSRDFIGRQASVDFKSPLFAFSTSFNLCDAINCPNAPMKYSITSMDHGLLWRTTDLPELSIIARARNIAIVTREMYRGRSRVGIYLGSQSKSSHCVRIPVLRDVPSDQVTISSLQTDLWLNRPAQTEEHRGVVLYGSALHFIGGLTFCAYMIAYVTPPASLLRVKGIELAVMFNSDDQDDARNKALLDPRDHIQGVLRVRSITGDVLILATLDGIVVDPRAVFQSLAGVTQFLINWWKSNPDLNFDQAHPTKATVT